MTELDLLAHLKTIAQNQGMTVQHIADATGLKRPNVTDMLNGKRLPNLKTLLKVCNALNLEISFKPISK